MSTKDAPSIKPLADRVVVLPVEEKPQSGQGGAVGEGKLSDEGVRINPDVSVGQVVLYGKYSGTEVNVGGEDYLILRESDILAVIG